ncbi:MAG: SiaB family protein kinase [Nautiliaceae bacterium]
MEKILKDDGIVFLTYGGFLTQSLIVGMTEALEKETQTSELSMRLANRIFIIFIELAQNMMNYSKQKEKEGFDPKGFIVVGKEEFGCYYVFSQNIIDKNDKIKIEQKLKEITSSTKEEIKKMYREARRSGKNTHAKGGGIGFYEIATRSERINYEFVPISDDKFYFRLKVFVGK